LRKCFSSFLFFCRKIFFSVSLQFLFSQNNISRETTRAKTTHFCFREEERKKEEEYHHPLSNDERILSFSKKKKKKKTTKEEKQTQKEI